MADCRHKRVDWEPLDLESAIEAGTLEGGIIPEVIAAFGICRDCKAEVAMDYVPTMDVQERN